MNVTLRDRRARKPGDHVHQAEALLLTCMDFRLTEAVSDYMKSRGLAGKYDHMVLAGGALGVVAGDNPAWAETFWQHLALARSLHGIQRLIVIDHRDCGACKQFIGATCADDRDAEMATHMRAMEELADEVKTREPCLEVELLLMDLDGSVEMIA